MIWLGIMLIVLAVALFVAEMFLPTSGMLGAVAALCAIGAIFCFFKTAWWLGELSVLAVVIITPLALYLALKIYPRTPVGKAVILPLTDAAAAAPFADEAATLKALEGKQGRALTLLRPAGAIEIDGQRIDALSDSVVIEPGTPIIVANVIGLKVIVKPLSSSERS